MDEKYQLLRFEIQLCPDSWSQNSSQAVFLDQEELKDDYICQLSPKPVSLQHNEATLT